MNTKNPPPTVPLNSTLLPAVPGNLTLARSWSTFESFTDGRMYIAGVVKSAKGKVLGGFSKTTYRDGGVVVKLYINLARKAA